MLDGVAFASATAEEALGAESCITVMRRDAEFVATLCTARTDYPSTTSFRAATWRCAIAKALAYVYASYPEIRE